MFFQPDPLYAIFVTLKFINRVLSLNFIKKLKSEYPFYNRRLKIRPGITGWAQIKQPFDISVKDVHQKLKYDFYYIENISFRLDMKILINTVWVVFWGHSR